MTPFWKQLEREGWWDVRVATCGLALFVACGLLLPRSWFWFYFLPMVAFCIRYVLVRCRRDEALLAAHIAAGGDVEAPGGLRAAGAYRCDGGICITDGTHHVLVGRDQTKPLLQLGNVRGRQ